MDTQRRPPSLNLLSSSSPARAMPTSPSLPRRQSQTPIRYTRLAQDSDESMDEKATPLSHFSPERQRPGVAASPSPSAPPLPRQGEHPVRSPHPSRPPPPFIRQSLPIHHRCHSQSYTRPRGLRIANLLKPWIPLLLYGITTLAFLIAIAMYRAELFAGLDELSRWLRGDEQYGQAVLFLLIFLTTFPPIPLYSTLIILSGYTFGPWTGAIISYFAALTGALCVFILSRALLRDCISHWLDSTCTMKRVVRAIERRPKLLFLIRLAPYPYNVMNCLLAASPTLTLRTYTVCTALSLFKVIIHTSLGASIHSFRDYDVDSSTSPPGYDQEDENGADTVARMWTIGGVILCIAILVYLSIVARRAVDDELDDELPRRGCQDEEAVAFLSPRGIDLEEGEEDTFISTSSPRVMAESPFRTHPNHLLPFRP